MKFKIVFLLGACAALLFYACDWNSHTEPEINVNNADILGQAILVNESPQRPAGVDTLYVNEGDTVEIVMSTYLLKQPNYVFTLGNGSVAQVVKDPQNSMRAWAIATADSGMATSLKITDIGNGAEKTIGIKVVRRWADPLMWADLGYFNGHRYYISTNLKTWAQAEEICRQAGGYMVAINTAEENTFLHRARGRIDNVWIGIRVYFVDNAWKITTWANGEPVEYRLFNSTDPGIFAEYYYHMDVNGNWESWHEISYNYFLEMD